MRFFDKAMQTNGVPAKVAMWTRAAPTKRPLMRSRLTAELRSWFGKWSTSTTSLSKTIVQPNASPNRCSISNHSNQWL